MMVILRDNVENLGRVGDLIKVSDGYARNYLLPRNLVVEADEKNIAAVEHQKRLLEKKRLAMKADAMSLAKKLEGFTVVLSRKVGEGDKLFGSVSTSDIADSLKKAGLTVEKRSLLLHTPIKSLGSHTVTVKLESEVTATLKVTVAKEN